MKSTKKVISIILIYAVIAAFLTVSTITIPFQKPAASWVAFAFSLISLIAGCGVTLFAFGKKDVLKSKFYGFPVFRIGVFYTIAQLVVALLIYIVGALVNLPYWIGLSISLLIVGLAAIGVIVTDNARDCVEAVDEKNISVSENIRRFQIDLADILDMCKDEDVLVALKKLAEKFKYSDVVSADETATVEEQIGHEVDELRNMMATESSEIIIDKIEKITKLLSSRNRLCETSKRK